MNKIDKKQDLINTINKDNKKELLFETNIKYFVANGTILYCPKSVANYFGFSYKYIAREIDKLSKGVIEFSNRIVMLTLEGTINLIYNLQAPYRKKRFAIREIMNEDIISIML